MIENCYDGDTCTVDADLGFNVVLNNVKIRLARIDAPEIRGPSKEEGRRSKKCLLDLLKNPLTMKSAGKGKYGRWIAELFSGGRNISDLMVDGGCAEYRDY